MLEANVKATSSSSTQLQPFFLIYWWLEIQPAKWNWPTKSCLDAIVPYVSSQKEDKQSGIFPDPLATGFIDPPINPSFAHELFCEETKWVSQFYAHGGLPNLVYHIQQISDFDIFLERTNYSTSIKKCDRLLWHWVPQRNNQTCNRFQLSKSLTVLMSHC